MKRAYGYKIAAGVILGIAVLFVLFISVTGILSGASKDIYNLIIMLFVVVLAFIAWKRLLLGGLLLCGFGIILAMYFFLLPTDLQTVAPYLLLICVPITISGLLFIEADWNSKKRN